ncbi:MAG: histidine phosphatase family protein [Vicinamibacterales bacterium]
MRLLLVRHAESQGNFELRLQGRREFPLTAKGIQQAEALVSRLAAEPLAAIYSSPIGRAMQTAEIIAAKTGLDVTGEPGIQEYDFGEAVSGFTWDEIRRRHPQIIEAFRKDDSEFPRYPGEEGRAAFRERVRSTFANLVERHAGDQSIAVVTHAGPITVLVLDALSRRYSRPIPFVLDNASITTIEVNNGAAHHLPPLVVTGINDGCHVNHLVFTDRAGGGA